MISMYNNNLMHNFTSIMYNSISRVGAVGSLHLLLHASKTALIFHWKDYNPYSPRVLHAFCPQEAFLNQGAYYFLRWSCFCIYLNTV